MKRIFALFGSSLCISVIFLMILLASSLFNENIEKKIKTVGREAVNVMEEFSKKAEINFLRGRHD